MGSSNYGGMGIPVSSLFPAIGNVNVSDDHYDLIADVKFSEHTNANYFAHRGIVPAWAQWCTYGSWPDCRDLPGFHRTEWWTDSAW
jgi:hypothetical protein